MENLARYIIRASFSQDRMTYYPDRAEVACRSKDGKEKKTFNALEWLAAMCSHVPDKGEQMVRYYGYYSNVSRGKRKLAASLPQMMGVPCIVDFRKEQKNVSRNWACLIKKIYEADPLVCPACGGFMRIIAFIEDPDVVRKILTHLGLWAVKPRPPPRKSVSLISDSVFADAQPFAEADPITPDPDYSWDDYIQS